MTIARTSRGLAAGAVATLAATASVLGSASPAHAVTLADSAAGWSAVTVAANPLTARPTVIMVSPTGGHYLVGTFAVGTRVADISPSGKLLLLEKFNNQGAAITDTLTVYNLATRTSTSFALKNDYPAEPMFNAAGTNIYLNDLDARGNMRVRRTNLAGSTLATFSNSDAVGVMITAGSYAVSQYIGKVETLSVLNTITGQRVRNLPIPAGYSGCAPLHADTSTTVIGVCQVGGAHWDIFSFPISGAAATNLTKRLPGYSMGYSDAWKLPGGTFAAPEVSNPAVVRVTSSTTVAALPGAAGGVSVGAHPVAATSTGVYMWGNYAYSQNTSTLLKRYDVATRTTKTIFSTTSSNPIIGTVVAGGQA